MNKETKRPYTICHMITSLDGRIDCGMLENLAEYETYCKAIEALNAPTTVTGSGTIVRDEIAVAGTFPTDNPISKEAFSKKVDAIGYEVYADSTGKYLWEKETSATKPHLILTSTRVSKEYLAYLDEQNISWIATGDAHVDLVRAMEILSEVFGVERVAVVGGSALNTGFLKAGLLDEISILIGHGIDGRKGMPTVFDGLEMDYPTTVLELSDVQKFDDGAVWLRYNVGQ